MTRERYPNLLPASIETLLETSLGSVITPALIEVITEGRADPAAVNADLDRAHMIDDEQCVTPLGAAVARLWRNYLAKEGAE